jgi:hypothetical protein
LLAFYDVVLFNNNNVHLIGKIVGLENNNEVSVIMFMEVTAKVLVRYSLCIVTKAEAPFALKLGMVKLLLTETCVVISRSAIINICCILPLGAVVKFYHILVL